MKHLNLFLMMVISYSCSVFGQASSQPIDPNQFINIGLQSPDAASLGKFGNIPVSYQTGIPNINIPIYEIKIGKIAMPISLDYHAGGIKVDEISSSIGTGWALNCGGVIVRDLVGMPDEAGGYLSAPASSDDFNIWDPASYEAQASFVAEAGFKWGAETQPDIFSYNILGQSGRFMFNHDGTVFQMPLTDNKINFVNATDGTSYFTITNENGIQFIFKQQEINTLLPSSITYISSWKLSSIKDLNTLETISFLYDNLNNYGTEFVRSDVWSENLIPETQVEMGYVSTEVEYPSPNPTPSLAFTFHNNESSLKEINWRGGKVSFINQQDRLDRPHERRLSEIDIFSTNNSTANLVKKVSLANNSYFHYNSDPNNLDRNYTHDDEYNYRMRLDNVSFSSIYNNAQPQVYKMEYDNTNMASRGSCGQDRWGFNNGQFSNTSMLATQTVTTSFGDVRTIGTANRNTNVNFIKACSIKSITYPTGGKTVFEMEPHQFDDPNDEANITQSSASCIAQVSNYNNTPVNTTSFTPPEGSHNFRYTFTITQYAYAVDNSSPNIKIVDQANNQQVFALYNNDPANVANTSNGQFRSFSSPFLFTPGHTYTITCTAYRETNENNVQVQASIGVEWDQYASTPSIGGGLRVKSITNYDANNVFINKESYEYSLGQLMTPSTLLSDREINTLYAVGNSPLDPYHVAGGLSSSFYSNSVLPVSSIGESPVLYNLVTKYQLSSDGISRNGKTEYKYNIIQDYYTGGTTDLYFMTTASRLISNSWKNGYLSSESEYKFTGDNNSPYSLIRRKTFSYSSDRTNKKKMINIYPRFIYVNEWYYQIGPNLIPHYFDFDLYQIPTGVMLLHQMINTDYDENNNALTTTENYYYNNPNYISLTQKTSTNSKGETITENYKYPYDFAAPGNQYQKMVNENNIEPVIQYQKLNGSTQLVQRNANYSDFNDPNPTTLPFIQPTSIDEKVLTNASDTRIKFNSYDNYGNITQQQKTDDMFQSYIWNYNSVYPVAKLEGAEVNDIAYTSFESDEANSNWSYNTIYPGEVLNTGEGFTGSSFYLMQGNAITTKNPLNSSKAYIVSYWTLNQLVPCTVSGTTGSIKRGATINGWTYYEHEVTGVASVSITGGNEGIDELRLHPKGSQMETYTYTTLVGVTSQCDAANHVTYYEYDGFNRLSIVRDQNRNILKTYCYNYAGQPVNCDGNASIVLQSNGTYNSFSISLTNTVTGKVYNFSVTSDFTNTTANIGTVPIGTYNVEINSTGFNYPTGVEPPHSDLVAVNFGSTYYDGMPQLSLTNVAITGNTNISFQF